MNTESMESLRAGVTPERFTLLHTTIRARPSETPYMAPVNADRRPLPSPLRKSHAKTCDMSAKQMLYPGIPALPCSSVEASFLKTA